MVAIIIGRLKRSPAARFVEKYNRDGASRHATVIAYHAILSMFPIMLALLAIVGIFVQDERTLEVVNNALLSILPADFTDDALRVVQTSRTGSGWFGLVGFLGLLWSGSALFGALAEAFNRAFGVAGRGFVKQKLMAGSMIFVIAFLMLVSLLSTSLATYLLSISRFAVSSEIPGFGLLEAFLVWLTSLLFSFVLFLSIYWIVPNRSFAFGQVWPGAAVGAFLFFVITQIWPLYVANFGRFNVFGAFFGLFFLIMTWFYFLAQIILVGAEINAFRLEKRQAEGD